MYVLGIDVGTTGTKTILFDKTGTKIGSAYKDYPLITLPDGGVEQRAEDWWDTVADTVRRATQGVTDKHHIKALALSTQGGSCVLTDEWGEALQNAQTWMDARPGEYIDTLLCLDTYIYEATGRKMSGMQMLPLRAEWYRNKFPDIWAKAKRFFTTVDYLNLRLTGCAVIDPTNAAATCFFNLDKNDWDDKILQASKVSRTMLPNIVESGKVISHLTADAAKELGLSEETIVVSGAQDQYAAAIGAGAVAPGDIMLSTGTSWVILGIQEKRLRDHVENMNIGIHAVPGLYGAMTSLATAGVAMEWFRKNFAETKILDHRTARISLQEIDEVAGTRIRKDKGLYFIPHFNGKTFPRWAPHSKATYIGISLEHDSYDMALAIMEGVVFDAATNIEAYEEKGFVCDRLKFCGGASKSELWTDILRHVTGKPLERFCQADIACAGAAALAGTACGMFSTIGQAARQLTLGNVQLMPVSQGEMREYYQEKYIKYKKLLEISEQLYRS